METIEVINVKTDCGAQGDGSTDDTSAIQDALDLIKDRTPDYMQRGAVFLPPGVYKISDTLKIPPKCMLFGLSGGYTQEGADDYTRQGGSVLRLFNQSNANMIEPDTNYESVIIQGITLDGNKSEHSAAADKCGIYMPDLTSENANRPNLILRDILIMNIKGTGFYAGTNQNEFLLDHVCCRKNTKHGFYFNTNNDISLNYVWAGSNDETGLNFLNCAAVKANNCDTWENEIGMMIENGGNFVFNKRSSNNNNTYGLHLRTVGDAVFNDCLFTYNSRAFGYHANIYLSTSNPNHHGCFGIRFIGCTIGQFQSSPAAKTGIEDSTKDVEGRVVKQNVIIGCTFFSSEFVEDHVCNVLGLYIVKGCTTGTYGEENLEKLYDWTNQNNYHILELQETIAVDTSDDNKTIFLPNLLDLRAGKQYLIIKPLGSNSLTIQADATINGGGDTLVLSSGAAWNSKRFVHGGSGWVAI